MQGMTWSFTSDSSTIPLQIITSLENVGGKAHHSQHKSFPVCLLLRPRSLFQIPCRLEHTLDASRCRQIERTAAHGIPWPSPAHPVILLYDMRLHAILLFNRSAWNLALIQRNGSSQSSSTARYGSWSKSGGKGQVDVRKRVEVVLTMCQSIMESNECCDPY